jgi:hypothetical protein
MKVFYHAISILSQRLSATAFSDTITISHASRSADSIISLTGDRFRGKLLPLSIVPYAVSLAMSVAYRELRSTESPEEQRHAMNRLHQACTILEELSQTLSTAEPMIRVAKQFRRKLYQDCTTAELSSLNASERISIHAAVSRELNGSDMLDSGSPKAHNPLTPIENDSELLFSLFQVDKEFNWNPFDSTFWSNMDLSLPTTKDNMFQFDIDN